MIKEDIQVIQRGKSIIVRSGKNFFSFSRDNAMQIEAFCTAGLSSAMVMDIIHSGIISQVVFCEDGNMLLSPKFGYDMLKMQDVIVGIFEKFDL